MIEDNRNTSRKYSNYNLGSVLVLGLGKTGLGVANYCLDLLGKRIDKLGIVVGDNRDETKQVVSQFQNKNIDIYYDIKELNKEFDLCISSPGISQFSSMYEYAKDKSREIISEVEFAWRESKSNSKWIAVTGTNGKTTTTALITHILKKCGKKAASVGNIGNTCIEAVSLGNIDYYVAEVSSYQLASTTFFAPDVAILLNITPDHLTWHKSMEAYISAKKKVYAHIAQTNGSVILDATNSIVCELIKEIKEKNKLNNETTFIDYIPIGTAKGLNYSMQDACGSINAAFLSNNVLTVVFKNNHHLVGIAKNLQIKGEHNLSNALAAASAVLKVSDASDCEIEDALLSFEPLEHRIEPCGIINGISFYNDSKATNVDATLKALQAFDEKKPIVLLGGDDKGTDLSSLVAQSERHTKCVVCFGAAQNRFLDAFSSTHLPHYRATNLENALDCAIEHAVNGDIILLSPACASFDEFSSYQQRGRVFKDMINARKNRKK